MGEEEVEVHGSGDLVSPTLLSTAAAGSNTTTVTTTRNNLRRPHHNGSPLLRRLLLLFAVLLVFGAPSPAAGQLVLAGIPRSLRFQEASFGASIPDAGISGLLVPLAVLGGRCGCPRWSETGCPSSSPPSPPSPALPPAPTILPEVDPDALARCSGDLGSSGSADECAGGCCAEQSLRPTPDGDVGAPWIALVLRGKCTFEDKVATAEAAGASAVVVGDNEGTGILVTMVTEKPSNISIPSVFISKPDYELLLSLVERTLVGGDATPVAVEPLELSARIVRGVVHSVFGLREAFTLFGNAAPGPPRARQPAPAIEGGGGVQLPTTFLRFPVVELRPPATLWDVAEVLLCIILSPILSLVFLWATSFAGRWAEKRKESAVYRSIRSLPVRVLKEPVDATCAICLEDYGSSWRILLVL
ncbi:hypothetical protein HK405_003731 [Cladochytrium tenue]|nr:hypothetical protein HK405_003731 [Cladochytrium tenue]